MASGALKDTIDAFAAASAIHLLCTRDCRQGRREPFERCSCSRNAKDADSETVANGETLNPMRPHRGNSGELSDTEHWR